MSHPLDNITLSLTRKQAAEVQQALLSLLKESVRSSKSVSELEQIVIRVNEIDSVFEAAMQEEQEARLTNNHEQTD
jgi:hypothetical protein